jgi:hypothetical protein
MTAGEQSETASASELQLLSHAAEALDEVQTRIAPLSAGRGTSTGASLSGRLAGPGRAQEWLATGCSHGRAWSPRGNT